MADKDSTIYTPVPRRTNQYALDAMSDDDDEDEEQETAQTHTVWLLPMFMNFVVGNRIKYENVFCNFCCQKLGSVNNEFAAKS